MQIARVTCLTLLAAGAVTLGSCAGRSADNVDAEGNAAPVELDADGADDTADDAADDADELGDVGAPDRTAAGVAAAPVPRVRGDGEVAEMLRTMNVAELEQATLIIDRLRDEGARVFAGRALREHDAANKKLRTLVEQQDIDTTAGVATAQLWRELQLGLVTLESAPDDDRLDALYLSQQVAQHRDVLRVIHERLLPAVEDAELRGHLLDVRDRQSTHMHLAQAYLAALPSN